jgi:hypothetical protein
MPHAQSPNISTAEYFTVSARSALCIVVEFQAPSTVVLVHDDDKAKAARWTRLSHARVQFTRLENGPLSQALYDRYFSILEYEEDSSSLTFDGDFSDFFPFVEAAASNKLCMSVVHLYEELDSGGEV